MPELPEVETIRRELSDRIRGRRIVDAEVIRDDLILGGIAPGAFAGRIRGRRISEVSRRAKALIFILVDPGEPPDRVVMRVQLRMSGRFWLGEGLPDADEFRHPGARFHLDDGRTLHYDDVRRLGGFDLMEEPVWRTIAGRLGPEPLGPAFTARVLREILADRRAPVKNVLLDQRRVAGIGNIYASESLFRAGIDPRRPGGTLTTTEVGSLRGAIRSVLGEALEAAGTTFRSYRAVNGRSGRFQTRLRVYGREGSACARCGTDVARVVQAGRSTFFCPACQT